MVRGKTFNYEYMGFNFEVVENISMRFENEILGWYVKGEIMNEQGIKILIEKYVSLDLSNETYSSYISKVVNWHLKRERAVKPFSFKRLFAEMKEWKSYGLREPKYLRGSLAEYLSSYESLFQIGFLVGIPLLIIILGIHTRIVEVKKSIREESYQSGYTGALLSICEIQKLTIEEEVKAIEDLELYLLSESFEEVKTCIEELETNIERWDSITWDEFEKRRFNKLNEFN